MVSVLVSVTEKLGHSDIPGAVDTVVDGAVVGI
jgi:hypothetical protein